jgi:hypothetical protein
MQRALLSNTVVLALILNFSNLYSQSISAPILSKTELCDTSTFDISFSVTGVFNSGNYFIAQLSDTSGFSDPKFVNLGSTPQDGAGPIHAALPSGTQAGKNYRVRILSTNPSSTSPTSQPIIVETPLDRSSYPNLKFFQDIGYMGLVGDTVQYSLQTTGNIVSYLWDFGSDAIPQTSTDSIPPPIVYIRPGLETPKLTLTTIAGCQMTFQDIDDRDKAQIFSCSPDFSTNVTTIHPDGSKTGSGSKILVLPGADYKGQYGTNPVFVSTGASFEGSGGVIYAQDGSSVSIPGGGGYVIEGPHASVTIGGGGAATAVCTSLSPDTLALVVHEYQQIQLTTLRVFPNPSAERIRAELSAGSAKHWIVFNVLGNQVFQSDQQGNTLTIPIVSLSNGSYFLRAETSLGPVEKRFVISR